MSGTARKMSDGIIVAGPLRDSEQALQGGSEEHRPRDESRDDGCCRAGKDTEQFPGGGLCGVTAGWGGGETQCPEAKGEGHLYNSSLFPTVISSVNTSSVNE